MLAKLEGSKLAAPTNDFHIFKGKVAIRQKKYLQISGQKEEVQNFQISMDVLYG